MVQVVCDLINLCTTLQHLSLDCFGPPLITKAILNREATLQDLTLTASQLQDHGCDKLAACISQLPNLCGLCLHLVEAESGFDVIWHAVASLPNLERLDLIDGDGEIDWESVLR